MKQFAEQSIDAVLNDMESITLAETKTVSLLNRVDHKYLINTGMLPGLLESLSKDYYVVEIGRKRILPYYTVYFDTEDLHYYNLHHNGKLSRYKFRSRMYVEGGQVFNEVKFKINKGKTFKSRIERSTLRPHFDRKFREFAAAKCNSLPADLIPTLDVEYNRITLVNKAFSERMTIDIDLRVSHDDTNHQFDRLVIVELKRDQGTIESPGAKHLRNLRCKQNGFSKYCIGIALTHNNVKANNFKERIRTVKKLCR